MIDLGTALKAKIPFIGVQTDDLVHLNEVLQSVAGKPIVLLSNTTSWIPNSATLYWHNDPAVINVNNYKKLKENETSCVLVNMSHPHSLVLDVGTLPTPERFIVREIESIIDPPDLPDYVRALKGLSVKSIQELLRLTMARTGALTLEDLRMTRQMLYGDHPGLYTLDTNYDFYDWPKPLKDWVDLNSHYFLSPSTPHKLVPRGLLLSGEPGVGKSMAAMVLAHHWKIPCFRLDVASSLTKYIGESEGRISHNLSIIEQNAPCVWLLDEAEKLFNTADHSENTSQRILSQILWWLQYHKARVITVMTTNNKDLLPKELYRAERLDRVIEIPKLTLKEAQPFAVRVYTSVIKDDPPKGRKKMLYERLTTLDKGTGFAHAEVRGIVYDLIKSKEWVN